MIIEIEVDDKEADKAKVAIAKLGYEIKENESESQEDSEGEPEKEGQNEMQDAGEEMKRQFGAMKGNKA